MKTSGNHASHAQDHEPNDEGELEDQMSKQSFPTSDPPSTWAGEDVQPDNVDSPGA